MKYVKQYDLPCFPDKKPRPGRRCVVGLQKGDTFVSTFRGFCRWIGGCKIGIVPAPTAQGIALTTLKADVQRKLATRIRDLSTQLDYEIALLQRWIDDPEQFAVTPEAE